MTDWRKHLGMPAGPAGERLSAAFPTGAGFIVHPGAVAENALRLRSGALDVSFIPPIEYAREGTRYVVLPGAAVSSREADDTVTLHVRRGGHGIATLAADPACQSEIVLAMILLQEQFHVRPAIVPVGGGLEAMLERADAALLAGHASLRHAGARAARLDLVEHWVELTGLPYVHGFWCAHQDRLTRRELAAFTEGMRAAARETENDPAGPVSCTFDPEEQEAVDQFFRLAFYHGMLPDVPDLRFVETEAEDG